MIHFPLPRVTFSASPDIAHGNTRPANSRPAWGEVWEFCWFIRTECNGVDTKFPLLRIEYI